MWGPLAEDQPALLLVLGLALAFAYVAGGTAVVQGLQHELARPLPAGGDAIVWPAGADPGAPPGAWRLAVAEATDDRGRAWTLAAVLVSPDGAPSMVGVGARAPEGVAFFGGSPLPRVDLPPGLPLRWAYVSPEVFAASAPAGGLEVFARPQGGEPPPAGALAAPEQGPRAFLAAGAGAFVAAYAALVSFSALVAVSVCGSLTAGALLAHRRDLALARALGASRGRMQALVAAWLARVVAAAGLTGTAAGIVASYALFTVGGRLGFSAPIAPAPGPALAVGAGVLAGAAMGAGWWAARGAWRQKALEEALA